MNSDELRAKFGAAYKIIQRERKMREYVFRNEPVVRQAKLAEIDKLLTILTEMKDALKEHVGDGYEQPTLLDVHKKADYG